MPIAPGPVRARNDPAQYDDLTTEWWQPRGRFAALHWLARSRAALIPPAPWPGAPLLDVGCGAGLLAPHLVSAGSEGAGGAGSVAGAAGSEGAGGAGATAGSAAAAGWRHVGVDLSLLSLRQARQHGVAAVASDAVRLPFEDGAFRCVVAGEILEHLPDLEAACAELARVLAPGGVLVVDTLNDTRFTRIVMIRIGERLPAMAPRGIHDPDLMVAPDRLARLLAAHGVRLGTPVGLRPSARDVVAWLLRRTDEVRMLPARSVAGVYQVLGTKAGGTEQR